LQEVSSTNYNFMN